MNLAIIGATGNVGRKTIEVLEKSKLKIDNLYLVASRKSAGKKLKFNKKDLTIEQLEKYDFSKAEITIFAAGSEIAKNWIPKASRIIETNVCHMLETYFWKKTDIDKWIELKVNG